MVIRSLLTMLGFQADTKQLNNYENALTGIIKMTKMLALGVAALGTAAFKTAGDMEQVEIAFETMLGSADSANKLIQEITAFAAQTPFELKGLVDSSKQLLAYGFAAKEIIPTMTILGDVAAGVGRDKLGTIVTAMGKIKSATIAQAEQLNMLQDTGIPIYSELAKKFGVSNIQVRKMISQNKVMYEDVNQALTGLATGTGKFAGLMQKQSKSFLGILSNIGDFFYNLTASIGKDLLPIGKEIAKVFLDLMEANKGIIKTNIVKFFKDLIYGIVFVIRLVQRLIEHFIGWENLFKIIQNVARNVFNYLAVVGITLIKMFMFFFGVIDSIVKVFGGWEKVLSVLIPIILTIIGVMKLWSIIQGILNAVMAINPINLIIIAIGALIAIIILLIMNWKKVVAFLKDIWGKFATWWANLWKGIGDWFKKGFEGIGTFFVGVWKGIVNFFVGVIQRFVTAWNKFIDFWKLLWTIIGDFFKGVWEGFTKIVSDVWNGAKDIILGIWTSITDGIKNLWQGAVDFITKIWQGVMDFIQGIKDFASGVGDFFSGLFGGGKKNSNAGVIPPAGVSTTPTNTNTNSNTLSVGSITVGVAPGTPAEQKARLEVDVKEAIKKAWDTTMTGIIVNNPLPAGKY